MEAVPEPIGLWQSVGPSRHNLLESFYQSPEQHAYLFQNYVFLTRMLQARAAAAPLLFALLAAVGGGGSGWAGREGGMAPRNAAFWGFGLG